MIPGIIMIAGDTSRSRCYLQALGAQGLLPERLLLLPSQQPKPGQMKPADTSEAVEAAWGRFEPAQSLAETAARYTLEMLTSPSGDVNAPEVVSCLQSLTGEVCLYSGFGGVLLGAELLACGKKFLHVHGGWLPDYKGSTTNHFSALEQNFCGASAIFIDAAIDGGKILHRRKFSPPEDMLKLDHIYDSLFRAEVLADTLRHYALEGRWPDSGVENTETRHYYIMHPVLRHVLALRGSQAPGRIFGSRE
jgi:methionyl-tRNA formyltransferase